MYTNDFAGAFCIRSHQNGAMQEVGQSLDSALAYCYQSVNNDGVLDIYMLKDATMLIGRRFSDTFVQSNIQQWPLKVLEVPRDKPLIVVIYNGEEK
ncbi:hypothetical protein NC652_041048 [Populus alba x Populus x berolinensis]|uniref:Uncharacterized protein n=1 Tax=Populus alba x Populus x berolinensis TaxID=444605 RepID=A0AAD6L816_9ROSI|nr:hypothetical protein NC652_041044 [Populus alba x Populus x berolinensis]KAJ6858633.1 hypothetical protein NC652_041047 [Populus alba x Populus x berolinensis]KAJ6858634.1 hypothetical protein NC652_041048 [Populus alba x Populus x berolinensis]KAJ6951996.1 hypothetical protein NC653_041228 [Populus alba x Populus x berolinensis]